MQIIALIQCCCFNVQNLLFIVRNRILLSKHHGLLSEIEFIVQTPSSMMPGTQIYHPNPILRVKPGIYKPNSNIYKPNPSFISQTQTFISQINAFISRTEAFNQTPFYPFTPLKRIFCQKKFH